MLEGSFVLMVGTGAWIQHALTSFLCLCLFISASSRAPKLAPRPFNRFLAECLLHRWHVFNNKHAKPSRRQIITESALLLSPSSRCFYVIFFLLSAVYVCVSECHGVPLRRFWSKKMAKQQQQQPNSSSNLVILLPRLPVFTEGHGMNTAEYNCTRIRAHKCGCRLGWFEHVGENNCGSGTLASRSNWNDWKFYQKDWTSPGLCVCIKIRSPGIAGARLKVQIGECHLHSVLIPAPKMALWNPDKYHSLFLAEPLKCLEPKKERHPNYPEWKCAGAQPERVPVIIGSTKKVSKTQHLRIIKFLISW